MRQASGPTAVQSFATRLVPLIQRYPFIASCRLPAVGWTVNARMPDWSTCDPELLTARLVLWIFALDDLADDPVLPARMVRRCLLSSRRVANGAMPANEDDIPAMLADIRSELAEYPLWRVLDTVWTAAAVRLIDGMLAEHSGCNTASLASYKRYGSDSIGTILDGWTLLIVTNDHFDGTQLPAIQAALEAGAWVVRLANDLNSASKEACEGKTNALTLLGSPESVERLLEEAVDSWKQALQRVETTSGRFEQYLAATVSNILHFYLHHDYHHFNNPLNYPNR